MTSKSGGHTAFLETNRVPLGLGLWMNVEPIYNFNWRNEILCVCHVVIIDQLE